MIHNAIHVTRIFSTSITCSFQQELAHEFCGDNQYLGSLRPQTAIQWHRACYFLWGTILAWGAQFSFGGHKQRFGGQGSGMSPVASGLLQLYSNFIKIKKKVFVRKCTRSFMKSGVGLHVKITKKQFLLTNSTAISTILRVSGLDLNSSSSEPIHLFGAQSSLGGGTTFVWGGHKQSFGGTVPEYPPWRRACIDYYYMLIYTQSLI